MALLEIIDAAQKEFTATLKDTEDRKKELTKLGQDVSKASGDVGSEVKRVMAALKKAEDALDGWSAGYDSYIQGMKDNIKDFATYKKKTVEIEKFYKDLKDEKDERDKARKKLGPGSKPTKEQEIADAAFKRAQTAYDKDPGRSVEAELKNMGRVTESMAGEHKDLVAALKAAVEDCDKLVHLLTSFTSRHAVPQGRKWNVDGPVGSDFDAYFKMFR